MAIFAIRSAKNVHEDSPNNPSNGNTNQSQPHSNPASRPTEAVPEEMMQFDDDMAHFVTHLDADPLAEGQLHLVEYNPIGHGNMMREISDDEDEYTYLTRRCDDRTNEFRLLSFQKLSYAAVTALLPPSRTPTPVNHIPGESPTSSHSSRKHLRQRDFTASIIKDNESDVEIDWNASKARRGKSRAKGLAKKKSMKAA
jgi:hypothetical protein